MIILNTLNCIVVVYIAMEFGLTDTLNTKSFDKPIEEVGSVPYLMFFVVFICYIFIKKFKISYYFLKQNKIA